jgi:hypothetical protein
MLEHELHTCTPKSPKLLSVLLLCVHLKNGRAEGKELGQVVCVCVVFASGFSMMFCSGFLPCSIYRGATPRRVNWPPSKSWTLPRYNGLLSFSIFFFRE